MDAKKRGKLLKTMRQKQGMPQLQAADKLHVSDKTVSKWERSLGFPDISMFHALSELYHLDLFALLSGALYLKQKDRAI